MKRLLLVEDNETNADMLSRRLRQRGFEVQVAIDGKEGLDAAIATAPDLVLLDMSLPAMDGWEVAQRLKGSPATSQIPVIALTAHAMPDDRERALAAGCDDYDSKPVDLARLLTKIREFLNPDEIP